MLGELRGNASRAAFVLQKRKDDELQEKLVRKTIREGRRQGFVFGAVPTLIGAVLSHILR